MKPIINIFKVFFKFTKYSRLFVLISLCFCLILPVSSKAGDTVTPLPLTLNFDDVPFNTSNNYFGPYYYTLYGIDFFAGIYAWNIDSFCKRTACVYSSMASLLPSFVTAVQNAGDGPNLLYEQLSPVIQLDPFRMGGVRKITFIVTALYIKQDYTTYSYGDLEITGIGGDTVVVHNANKTPVTITASDGQILYGLKITASGALTQPTWFAPTILIPTITFLGPEEGSLNLEAQILDGNANAISSPVKKSIKNGDVINLPLGGLANLSLKDSLGNMIPASYQLKGPPIFSVSDLAVDSVNGLYLDRLALLFNGGAVLSNQEIMPVHLGTQSLTITPQDSASYPPLTISLNVTRPIAVGSGSYDCSYKQSDGNIVDMQYEDCDDLIIDQAHAKGLPPQFIKAEIWKESLNHAFVQNSFRYEPDYDNRYIKKLINTDKNVYEPVSNPTYDQYFQMAAVKNSNISFNQLHPRSKYSAILSNGKVGLIPDNFETSFKNTNYNPLTAWNMVNVDYNYQTNSKGVPDPQGWFKDSDGELLPSPKQSNYNFVAQTLVASSYGLMQIMYKTAVGIMKYEKNGIGKDPILLFRPSVNVDLGTGYLARQIVSTNHQLKQNINTFSSLYQYQGVLKAGAAGYNAGGSFKSKNAQNYGKDVLNKTISFWITEQPSFEN